MYGTTDHGHWSGSGDADEFVELYKQRTGHPIVEPAHMELAEPSIGTAFKCCVEQGATRVIICPYFLFPGRHWDKVWLSLLMMIIFHEFHMEEMVGSLDKNTDWEVEPSSLHY
jgi:hypothetical protein